MPEGVLQATVRKGLVHWPHEMPESEDIDDGKETGGSEDTKESEEA